MTIQEMKTEIDAVRLRIAYARGIELVNLTVALDALQTSLVRALEREIAAQYMFQVGRVA